MLLGKVAEITLYKVWMERSIPYKCIAEISPRNEKKPSALQTRILELQSMVGRSQEALFQGATQITIATDSNSDVAAKSHCG